MLIGNAGTIINSNSTISGTLQSFQTSILGTSVSVIDSKLNTGIIGDIFGTTSSSKQINIADNLLINSGGGNNYIQFRNSGTILKQSDFKIRLMIKLFCIKIVVI